MSDVLASGNVRAGKVFELLVRAGWRQNRISGSHHVFTRDGHGCLPIAVHGGKLRRDVVRHVLRIATLEAEVDLPDYEGDEQRPSSESSSKPAFKSQVPPKAKPLKLEGEKWVEVSADERELFAQRSLQQEEARRARRESLQAAVSAAQVAAVTGDLTEAERLLSPLLPAENDTLSLDEMCELHGYELAGDALFFYTEAVARLATAGEAAIASEAHRPRLVRAVRLCTALRNRFVEHREAAHELLDALLGRIYGTYVDALAQRVMDAGLAAAGADGVGLAIAATKGRLTQGMMAQAAQPYWSKQGGAVDDANDALRTGFAFITRLARDEKLPQLSAAFAPQLCHCAGEVVSWVSRATIIHFERGYVAEACELFETLDYFVKQHAEMITHEDEANAAALRQQGIDVSQISVHGVPMRSVGPVAQVRGLARAALSMRPAIEHASTTLHWVPIVGFGRPQQTSETSSLTEGCRVTLSGLSREDLNGLQGRAVRRLPETGRWQVTLDAGESKSLKPENLVVVPAAGNNGYARGWSSVLDAAERLDCKRRPLPQLKEQMELFFKGAERLLEHREALSNGSTTRFVLDCLCNPIYLLQHQCNALTDTAPALRAAVDHLQNALRRGDQVALGMGERTEVANTLAGPRLRKVRQQIAEMLRWLERPWVANVAYLEMRLTL